MRRRSCVVVRRSLAICWLGGAFGFVICPWLLCVVCGVVRVSRTSIHPSTTPTHTPLHTPKTGLALVKQGAQNRRNAATKLNLDSSRSHSVFTIELVAAEGGEKGDAGAGKGVGTLWIVDLAGSERSHRAGNWQDR